MLDSVISILENRIYVPTIILESTGCTYVTRVKINVSHSLIAVGAVGVESHCILGTADESLLALP